MIVIHVDMDAFFAALEQRERGISGPVVVGADPKSRGVVSTANYEARDFGIRSGMPISAAYRKCPDAVYLRPDFGLYRRASAEIMNMLKRYADVLEPASIDEAYLDVSSLGWSGAEEAAEKIKGEVLREEQLTCSVGVGPNKLVAKLASDHEKPDGLTVVRPAEVRGFMHGMPVRQLPGVGKKTEPVLRKMGIRTIGDLAAADRVELVRVFGLWGEHMHSLANGEDNRPVTDAYEVKSVGREHTFESDVDDVSVLHDAIDAMADDIAATLGEEGYTFRTVVLKARYANFDTHTKQKTIKPSASADVIKKNAKMLLEEFMSDRKIRLVGIRVAKLSEKPESLEKYT